MGKLYNRKRGLVSVVISAYNYSQFIGDALESVKNQTYPHIELIVVDDCSTDDTEKIIKKWYRKNENKIKKFVYLKLPRNCGAGWALNIGFAISEGEYIVIHDADDISHREKIKKQVNLLEKHENTAMIGTGYWTFQENIEEAKNGSNWLSYNPASIERNYKVHLRHCVSYGTLMFRAAILEEIIGCFKGIPVGNDMFFVNNVINHNYVVENIKENLFYVRQHKDQMSSKIRKKQLNTVLERRKKIEGRVSIILPIKNSAKTVEAVLEGIAAQTYKNIELIIVDDFSSDNTENIIKSWRKIHEHENCQIGIKDIIYFKLPREVGYPWVYNIGAYISKGEYIAFSYDKGVSYKDRIQKQVKFLKDNFMYSVVGTNFTGDNSWIKYDDDIEYSYTIDYMPCVNINTIMMRYDVINKTAGLNTKIQGAEDFEFICRLLNNGYRIQNLKEVLYDQQGGKI